MRARLLAVLATFFVVSAGAAWLVGQTAAADPYTQLRWRYVGPPGNRTDAVTGVPGDPTTYYVGAASGGIFKSTDEGLHWAPIFDDEPDLSIGALAVADTDHNVVWAGTGEAFIRSHISIGDGVYKSTDAGATWQFMGLPNSGRISRIAIDPADAQTVFVCALGNSYGDQVDRGLYRTTDGGKTWDKVLYVDEKTGCSDVAIDRSNPRIVYAGMWQFVIHTWGQDSGGPGSGLFKSTDGGVHFARLDGGTITGAPGLPHSPVGKVNVAIAQSNPQHIYAMIETGDGFVIDGKPTQVGVLWESTDGGAAWTMVSANPGYQSRTHYYNRVAVSTDNEFESYFIGNTFYKSIDGGRTTAQGASPGGDNHDMWIDPTNADNMAVANDSGVSVSHDRGRVWNHVSLPIAQIYHVTTDDAVPYHLYGNKQDGNSYMGPSQTGAGGRGGGGGGFGAAAGGAGGRGARGAAGQRNTIQIPGANPSLAETGGRGGGGGGGGRGRGGAAGGFPTGGPIPSSEWRAVGGGESGFAMPDPVDSNIVWSSGSGDGPMGGIVTRLDLRTGQVRNVEIWPDDTLGADAAQVKYRFNWEFPLAISPFDHNKMYAGSQYVHVTTDGGNSWSVISPDLTLNDKSKQGGSGGLTQDNIGVEYFDVVFAIAESPKQQGVIWAGTNDGLVQLTRNGGTNWTNVTPNIPGMPKYATVSNIFPSPFDAGTAYISVDGHQVDLRDPYIFKTTDFGATWTAIVNGLPHEPNGYVHCVIADPVRKGLLFAGTEGGVYVSFNDGADWQPLQNNLPHVPVYWLTIQNTWHDLDIATYGRGFWILDDISPLEQLPAAPTTAVLFPVRKAYEFRGGGGFGGGGGNDNTAGNNPPAGADINYYLPEAASGPVRIAIVNAQGETVRTLNGTGSAHYNRVWWDLRGPSSRPIMVRTLPLNLPSVALNAQGERTAPSSGTVTLSEPPGTYTVRLTVDGQTYTQPLEVAKDPKSPATDADFAAQDKLERSIFDELNELSDLLNQVEVMRVQLGTLTVALQTSSDGAPLRQQAAAIDAKFYDLETGLYKNQISGAGEDEDRQAPALADALTHLFGVFSGTDYPPTTQDIAVNEVLAKRLADAQQAVRGVVTNDVAALNSTLQQRNLAGIGAGMPAAGGSSSGGGNNNK